MADNSGIHLVGSAATLLLLLTMNASAMFTATPASVNASLGSTAVFWCNATGRSAFWHVDGVPASRDQIRSRDITFRTEQSSGIIRSSLHVPATTANNNTEVVCNLRPSGSVRCGGNIWCLSEPAILKVQGLVSAPADLQVIPQSQFAVQIAWKAPFSLDITRVDPDIHRYTLYITYTNTDETTAVNVSGTEYTLTVQEEPNPCNSYMFQVSAWNVVGEGKRSSPVTGYFPGAPHNFHCGQVRAKVLLLPHGVPQVQLALIQVLFGECEGRRPQYYSVRTRGTYITGYLEFNKLLPMMDHEMNIIVFLPNKLPHNELYTAVVTAENVAGNTTCMGSFRFSTFDLQAAYVTLTASGKVCISCYFAEGSTAQGCKMVLRGSTQTGGHNFTIVRNYSDYSIQSCGSILTAVQNDTVYSCNMFDVEQTGEVGMHPAYHLDALTVVQPYSYTDQCYRNVSMKEDAAEHSDPHLEAWITAGSVAAVCLATTLLVVTGIICKQRLQRKSPAPNRKDIVLKPNSAYGELVVAQSSRSN